MSIRTYEAEVVCRDDSRGRGDVFYQIHYLNDPFWVSNNEWIGAGSHRLHCVDEETGAAPYEQRVMDVRFSLTDEPLFTVSLTPEGGY